ncbi:hypothetical protein TH53_15815 [Pedobacter lusitanus]|uniref:Uncharacterized protein n=1 Tax=Pedobacter lusitanus TaxID=1503925 RepID=A0A0D0F438_9SPHI|nr:hypothetical protein [Pedobacter lusitanus]KIO76313.1 hypothetical protein TH53_15815 [Pedobacter lusitanus]
MRSQKVKIILLSLCATLFVFFSEAAAQQQQASVITAKSPEILYLGAAMEQRTINNNQHEVLDIIQDDIVINFNSLNAKSKTIKAQKEPLYKAIDAAISATNLAKWQNKSFSFAVKELGSYKDMELFFGQTIDPKTWFSVPDPSLKPMTLLAINLERVAFTVDMELPETGTFRTNDGLLAKYNPDDIIYTSTLSFGRRAIIIVESNIGVSEVKSALAKILKRESLSDRDKSILANCIYRVLLLGNNSIDLESKQPVQQAMEYVEAEITTANYGQPISFGSSYLKNHQIFNNKY